MEELFAALSRGLEQSPALAVLAAFGWGIASIALSPCHLMSVPLAVGYLGSGPEPRRSAWSLSVVLAACELVALALVGALTVAAGRIAGDLWGVGTWIVAALLLLAGLVLLGVIPLPSFGGAHRREVPRDLRGAATLGATLGVTLGPCSFGFMAPVLAAALAAPPAAALAVALGFAAGHVAATIAAGVLGARVGAWLRSGRRFAAIGKAIAGALSSPRPSTWSPRRPEVHPCSKPSPISSPTTSSGSTRRAAPALRCTSSSRT